MMHFIQVFGILTILSGSFAIGFIRRSFDGRDYELHDFIISRQTRQPAENQSIPQEYILHNNSYYKYHINVKIWADARLVCEEEGGHLAIVNSDDEASFLVKLMETYPADVLNDAECTKDYILVGIHSLFKPDEWVTIDDKSLNKSGYNTWAPGEPNNHVPPENCGSFYRYGGLNDFPCWCKIPFVCETPVTDFVQLPNTVVTSPLL